MSILKSDSGISEIKDSKFLSIFISLRDLNIPSLPVLPATKKLVDNLLNSENISVKSFSD